MSGGLPVIGEAFEQARRGESSFLENQRIFLDRNGYIEETFFTFSFSPIRDESGGIGGLFHPVTETTGSNLHALSALSMLLADEGLDVASASRGEQALKLAASNQPDVAVIGMKMPGMSGLELLQRLRERQPDLPVVIMSGLMERDLEVAKARQSTGVAYVGKPVDVDELLRAIGTLFPARSGQK